MTRASKRNPQGEGLQCSNCMQSTSPTPSLKGRAFACAVSPHYQCHVRTRWQDKTIKLQEGAFPIQNKGPTMKSTPNEEQSPKGEAREGPQRAQGQKEAHFSNPQFPKGSVPVSPLRLTRFGQTGNSR
jgi:hypothetical protein